VPVPGRVCRCSGVQVFRCAGVQVFRLQVCMCSGVQVFMCAGVQVFRCAGVQVFRLQVCMCSGVHVCRYSGVQVFGCSGVQVCRSSWFLLYCHTQFAKTASPVLRSHWVGEQLSRKTSIRVGLIRLFGCLKQATVMSTGCSRVQLKCDGTR